LIGFQRMFA